MKNLNTVLPIYDAATEQYRYREDVEIAPCLVFKNNEIPPIIIRRTHSAGTDANLTIKFYTVVGSVSYSNESGSGHFTITTGAVYDYIVLTTLWDTHLANGTYYVEIVDAYPTPDKSWFTETFVITDTVATYMKLSFSNDTILAGVKASFTQYLYINNTLKTPEYLREDTGEKRDTVLVKEKQVVAKAYTTRVMTAAEYLVDVLMLLPLQDTVTLVDQASTSWTFDEVRVKDPEWLEDTYGSRAKVEIQFIDVVAIKKLNFKEVETSTGGGMSAYIETGVGVTVADADVFTLTVTFGTNMPDTNYTPYVYALSVVGADVQIPYISNVAVSGFEITTNVACNVRWSAIHE